MTSDPTRNPLFIPDKAPTTRRVCPKCGHDKFGGRKVQGTVTYTCANEKCGNKWQGGLGVELQDPRVPHAPDTYVPPLRFDQDPKTGEPVEYRRNVDLTTDFRKGAPIPDEEE